MSKSYAAHLKKIGQAANQYGLQIGGMALATVAVRPSSYRVFLPVLIFIG